MLFLVKAMNAEARPALVEKKRSLEKHLHEAMIGKPFHSICLPIYNKPTNHFQV